MMASKYKNPWPGSKARNLQRSRNLQNLHFLTIHDNVTVVPSVSKKKKKKNYFLPTDTLPQHNLPPSLISPPIIPTLPKQKKAFQQPVSYQNSMNMYRRKSKKQRRRDARQRAVRKLQNASNYHWFDPNVYPPEKKNETTEMTTDAPEESYFEEVEVASDDNEGQQEIPVGFRKSKLQYLKYKKQLFFKPKIYKFGQRTIVNCLSLKNEVTNSPDVDVVSETEYEIDIENEKSDQVDCDEKSDQVDCEDKLEEVVIDEDDDDDDCQIIFVKTNINIPEQKKDSKTESRIYQTCISDGPDLLQGKSLIQRSLDSWKSHLIGLQYLIEVQNTSKDSVLKYHCVLCSEDISIEGFPAISVINHINGYKHVVKYLENHFPACGYSFEENGSYDNNVVIIQKVCEEINKVEGYYFMCITKHDQFEKSKEKMQEIIMDAAKSIVGADKVNISLLQNTYETIVMNEVNDVLNNILDEISPVKDSTKKALVETCNEAKTGKDKPKTLKPKRSSAVSSYLKLKMASSIFKKPQKGKSSKTVSNEVHQKNSVANTGEISGTKSKIPKKDVVKSKVLEKNSVENKESSKEGIKTVIKVVNRPPLKAMSKVPSNMVIKKQSKVVSKTSSNVVIKTPSKVVNKVLSKAISKARSKTIRVPVKAVPKVAKPISRPKVDLKSKEKAVLTPSMHSKHCLKRVLGKENSSKIEENAAGVSLKPSVKHQSGGDRTNSSSVSKSVVSEKKKVVKKVELKRGSKTSSSVRKQKSPLRKVTSVKKVSEISSMSPIKRRSKSPYRIVNYKKDGKNSHEVRAVIRNTHKKLITRTESPRRRSRSPYKRTVRRKSKSPLRPVIKSPIRISPLRKRSRTPVRRRPRTPVRKDSRSPIRRQSRSPVRRHSRSPTKKYFRSPVRRQSRSPFRRHSRSPVKRHSRSPFRRVSRSPIRRHSRSPHRKYSRSPLRRHSRSPIKRHSRSPHRRHSRSPLRRSRSPHKRHSRSPLRRHSRSPRRGHSRSPVAQFKSSYRNLSPSFEHRLIQDHKNSLFSSSKMSFDMQKLLEYKDKHASKHLSPNRSNPSKKFIHTFASESGRDIDLDPVSDEDESVYFNTDKQQHTDRQMSPSKVMLAQFFRKFSMSDESPHDITLNKFMQFMQAHSDELKELMGSQVGPRSSMSSASVNTSAEERNLLLKQYLLSNLAGNPGNIQGAIAPNIPYSPSVPNVPPPFIQPPFIPNQPPPSFGHVPHIPTQNIPPSQNQEKIFPPNLSMPPPERFPQFNQPHQAFPPKPQVPPEVMFKDLKATVSKLFGANQGGGKQDKIKNVPSFVTEPDPDMWDRNHPDSRKFNPLPVQKSMFFSPGKNSNFHGIPGISVRDEIPPSYDGSSTQFFNSRGNIEQTRPNIPVPPADAKVSFCDVPAGSSKGNLFPVVSNSARMSSNRNSSNTQAAHDVKVSLASRLASVLVKVGMIDVPAPLLQEMLMKIGAFSSSPPQDITEAEIVSILKRLGYLS